MALWMQHLKLLLVSALILASSLVSAVEINDLFVADVSADQSQRQWQNNALAQVLTRLTGLNDFSAYPAISAELNNASRYVKQFESVRQDGSTRLKVLLDATLIKPLLQQNNIAIWGAHRPEILVWIVQQQTNGRQFLRLAEHELIRTLQQKFKENSIPVTLPLYDIEDLQRVTETDVWAGFWQPINLASERYRPDMLMTIALDEINQDGTVLQRLSWQRQSPLPGSNQFTVSRNEVTAADIPSLATAFISELTAELAAEQAVVLQAESQSYQLTIENLQNLADVLTIERLLNRVLGVTAVTLTEFAAGHASFEVKLQIELAQLTQILQWEPALEPLQNAGLRSNIPVGVNVADLAVGLSPVSRADALYRYSRR